MPLITTDLNKAQHDLESGKPVAIPTETVYGLAALINNEASIRQVFAMKQRPLNHPLIVHVAPDCDLNPYVSHIPDYAQKLMQHFWPGPLTIVFKTSLENINSVITAGQFSVAIRCPKHSLTESLLKSLPAPLVAPSANPFGKISPTTAEHVMEAFINYELTILDGGRCSVGIESTILDATNEDSYQILRQGLITQEAIAAVIPTTYRSVDNTIKVPGKLASHYQPEKNLYYFNSNTKLAEFCKQQNNDVYVLAPDRPKNTPLYYFHPLPSSAEEMAYELYYQLRVADHSTAKCIAIILPKNWAGVRERIIKAGINSI